MRIASGTETFQAWGCTTLMPVILDDQSAEGQGCAANRGSQRLNRKFGGAPTPRTAFVRVGLRGRAGILLSPVQRGTSFPLCARGVQVSPASVDLRRSAVN